MSHWWVGLLISPPPGASGAGRRGPVQGGL